MTLLFVDGFDNYNSSARALEKWDNDYGGAGYQTTGGRTGGYCNLQNGFDGPRKTFGAGNSHATYLMGVAVNRRNNGGQQDFAFLSASGTRHETYFAFIGGAIVAYRSNANGISNSQIFLGQSVPWTVRDDGWDYFEFLCTLHASAGVMQARKNGVLVLNLTGLNTISANSTIDAIELQTFAGNPMIDDLYVCNAAGSAPHNTFLGDCRVRQLLPTGAGATTNFTPSTGSNYQNVDEVPANQTDYNTGTTDGDRDTYAMADLTEASGATVYGVQESFYAAKMDAGTKYGAAIYRRSGVEYIGASQALSTSYRQYMQMQAVDPSTSAAWSVAGVNALEVGMAAKDS